MIAGRSLSFSAAKIMIVMKTMTTMQQMLLKMLRTKATQASTQKETMATMLMTMEQGRHAVAASPWCMRALFDGCCCLTQTAGGS